MRDKFAGEKVSLLQKRGTERNPQLGVNRSYRGGPDVLLRKSEKTGRPGHPRFNLTSPSMAVQEWGLFLDGTFILRGKDREGGEFFAFSTLLSTPL